MVFSGLIRILIDLLVGMIFFVLKLLFLNFVGVVLRFFMMNFIFLLVGIVMLLGENLWFFSVRLMMLLVVKVDVVEVFSRVSVKLIVKWVMCVMNGNIEGN